MVEKTASEAKKKSQNYPWKLYQILKNTCSAETSSDLSHLMGLFDCGFIFDWDI